MAKSKLNGKIDEIIEMIIDGKTYRQMAEKFNVSLGCLHAYTSLDEHSARVKQALDYSASTYDDQAEEILSLIHI
mgnify:CR=1 FL=1